MIKKIVLSLCLFLSIFSFAQQATSSPYSFYGIGDVKFKGTIENNSMGGIAVFADSIHVNIKNPALLSSLKLTTFAIGGSYTLSTIKTYADQAKTKRFNFDYLAVGIPIKNGAISLGLLPYSAVGYKIQTIPTEANPAVQKYDGTGGINKVFSGFGYQITKNFSLGINIDYNFGKIETTSIVFQDGIQYGTREMNQSNVSGVNFNTGIGFKSKLNKKLIINSSISYAPQSTLNLSNTRNLAIVAISSLGTVSVIETNEINVNDTKLKLPSKLTFGAGIGQDKKWMIGAEVSFLGTRNFSNRFIDITNVNYENATKINVGGFYIPKFNSFSNYLNKVNYRGGFRYENTGLVINSKSINEQAFSFGLGLPISGTLFSNINIGYEFGKRGTVSSGLVQENFNTIMIGLSFNDKWFQKRKYD